jgi:hypothetical protein
MKYDFDHRHMYVLELLAYYLIEAKSVKEMKVIFIEYNKHLGEHNIYEDEASTIYGLLQIKDEKQRLRQIAAKINTLNELCDHVDESISDDANYLLSLLEEIQYILWAKYLANNPLDTLCIFMEDSNELEMIMDALENKFVYKVTNIPTYHRGYKEKMSNKENSLI